MPFHVYDPRTRTALNMQDAVFIETEGEADTNYAGYSVEDIASLKGADRDAFKTAVLSSLPPMLELYYTQQGDRLTPQQLSAVMRGNYTAAANMLPDDIADITSTSANTTVKVTLSQMGLTPEHHEIDNLPQQCLTALYEADVSDPIQQLLDQTPPVLLRYPLHQLTTTQRDRRIDRDDAHADLWEILLDTGLEDSPQNLTTLEGLLDGLETLNDSTCLYVVAHHEPAVLAPRETVQTVTITDPWLALINIDRNCGAHAQFSGQMNLKIDPAQTVLDGVSQRRFIPDTDWNLPSLGVKPWDQIRPDTPQEYITEMTVTQNRTPMSRRLAQLLQDSCHEVPTAPEVIDDAGGFITEAVIVDRAEARGEVPFAMAYIEDETDY